VLGEPQGLRVSPASTMGCGRTQRLWLILGLLVVATAAAASARARRGEHLRGLAFVGGASAAGPKWGPAMLDRRRTTIRQAQQPPVAPPIAEQQKKVSASKLRTERGPWAGMKRALGCGRGPCGLDLGSELWLWSSRVLARPLLRRARPL
jgi:hypothetical protein